PMGFGEARQAKSVCRVVFAGDGTKVEQLPVPCFQDLERIEGDWETITGRLSQLAAEGSRAWLEIVYDGDEIAGDLRERLVAAVQGTKLEILRVKNDRVIGRALEQGREQETLDDLDEEEVFQRCLQAHDIPQAQQPALVAAYRETLRSLREEDSRAE
ncbi:MAG TPA: exonuclease sbcCD subunit D, partial [Sedimenticola sp.]|nr:exonuclease sbcCD subunit D [Sedimenticola sp.]